MALNSPLSIAITQDPIGIPKELQPYFADLYNAIQQLQQAFVDFAGIAPQDMNFWSQLIPEQTILAQNANRMYLQTTEAVGTGAMVNCFFSGGVLKARNANATNNTKPCHGYCNVVGGGGLGDYIEVIMFHGLCTLFSGLTAGTGYYLSTVNGGIQAVAPVAAGNVEQFLGIAIDDTSFFFQSHYRIQH